MNQLTSKTCVVRLASILVLTLSGHVGLALADQPASFQGLGALPGSQFGSFARAISEDGTAVTGNSDQSGIGGSFFMAYRWQAGVMVPLGDLLGGSNTSESGGISADGSAAGGMSFSVNGTEAFRWVNGVMEGVGDVPGGPVYSHGFNISGDGSTVVGLSLDAAGDAAFRWKNGVMIDVLDDFPLPAGGVARACSHDGNVVVGMMSAQGMTRPFRWENGIVLPIDLPPGAVWGGAMSVSPDGNIIVGTITYDPDPAVTEAFRWEAGVMTLLGDLPGGSLYSGADDVSADGNTIVGTGRPATGLAAFIWTPAEGMRAITDVLVNDYGVNISGWRLDSANGVSADGKTIAGTGLNPAGRQEAWIAHIGCARPGDYNNDGDCDGDDIAGLVRCLTQGLGCACGDFTFDSAVTLDDVGPFIESVLE